MGTFDNWYTHSTSSQCFYLYISIFNYLNRKACPNVSRKGPPQLFKPIMFFPFGFLLESDLHTSLVLASGFLPSSSHSVPFFLTLLLLTISLSSFLELSLPYLSLMGNALRFLYRSCFESDYDSNSLTPHGITPSTAGVSALAQDIFHYEITSQVPEGLSQYVVSSKKAQANWYNKLLQAWKEAKPPPRTSEEAARLVVQTLKRHKTQDVEGLLAFYGLALPQAIVQPSGVPPSLPQGVQFELRTLPVDGKAVADGDTITVYVDTANPRESSNVPREIHQAAIKRSEARAAKNYTQADAFHKVITDAGYRVLKSGQNNEEVLARKYRIRLKGIDAPESSMPYGKEAKEQLLNIVQGQCLQVFVYGEDRYNRSVADIYCNGLFVQELMLKKGCAWHYVAYDQRPELAAWEREARSARVGLWAASNPEMPWEWRKNKRNGA